MSDIACPYSLRTRLRRTRGHEKDSGSNLQNSISSQNPPTRRSILLGKGVCNKIFFSPIRHHQYVLFEKGGRIRFILGETVMIMRKATRAFTVIAALILLFVDCPSRAKDVYKWVDEKVTGAWP